MRLASLVSVAVLSMTLTGCMSTITGINNDDMDRMQKKVQLMQDLMKEPDTAAWYAQREQIAQALGDHVFDKDFNRVFDSLTVALASMGMTVDNMERQSGYIAAHGQLLPPEQTKQLRSEELSAWCIAHNYPPSLLERRGQYDMMDPDIMGGTMMQRFTTTLTISVVKQSEEQTKVKLRFNGIYYPQKLEASYGALWPALDKQIFMDKGSD